MTGYENALWNHLVEHHDADRIRVAPAVATSERARRPRRSLALGTAVAGVAAVAAAVFALTASTGTTPAYALTPASDGTYTLTLNDMTTGIPALNARLAQLGIHTTVVPITAGCPATGMEPIEAPSGSLSMSQTVTIGNRWIPDGYHGFVAAAQEPDGQILMAMGTTPQPIPSCFPATPAIVTPDAGQSG
jgi:hypothetical protein